MKNIDINAIQFKLKKADTLDRCEIIESLSQDTYNADVVKLLLENLNDRNYLVRCSVCESLECVCSNEIVYALVKRLQREPHSLVRTYIISTISTIAGSIDIGDDIIALINSVVKSKPSEDILVAYYTLLYVLYDDKKYIRMILQYLYSEDYHIRFIVINSLSTVINCDIKDIVLEAYNKKYDIEESLSVKKALMKEIKKLS